jgi:glycosyltransferase involved in cell wall biosynthesis
MSPAGNPIESGREYAVPHGVGDAASGSVSVAASQSEHIDVCICTYKRPGLLKRLLDDLIKQGTCGRFSYSIVVVDNDQLESARALVEEFASAAPVSVRYFVEPRQNIALARNKAVENAEGDFVAFIDDDEFPAENWLLNLYQACKEYKVDGVLGPVKRHFDEEPPKWILKSRFYDRRINPTGTPVSWQEARTGNVLIKREVCASGEMAFRREFRAGEDQDFFRRKIEKGYSFIWSAEAVVHEVVPPVRWKRSYMMRKALLRGATAALQPNCGPLNIAKSVIAVGVYSAALPFTLLFGHHVFMTLLVKLCDHLGKLLAFVGLNPVKEEYVAG